MVEESRDLEHLSGTLAIARRDDGRVHVLEPALLEELVGRKRQAVSYALDRSNRVGAAPQVDLLTEELHGKLGLGDGIGCGLARAQVKALCRVYLNLLLATFGGGLDLSLDDDANALQSSKGESISL